MSNKPTEYLCQIDSGRLPTVVTTWTITSPNTSVWSLSIDTSGIITITDGAVAATTPFAMGMDGVNWTFTISNGGIITLTRSGSQLTEAHTVAGLVDSLALTWLYVVSLNDQVLITTENPLENLYYYPAIIIMYDPINDTGVFELHAVKPNTIMHRR